MPPYQFRNPAMFDVGSSDVFRNGFQYLHEPLGGIAVWNGQFETGPGNGSPAGWPEGWELYTYAGGTVDRVNGGFAGNWRMRGGQVGTGAGGYIVSLRFIPVSVSVDYNLGAAFIGSSVNSQIYLGCECYDAAKAGLGNVWTVGPVSPGVAWVHYQTVLGPAGTAWPANTRYARVRCVLQSDATLTNDWAYVDHVEFYPWPW